MVLVDRRLVPASAIMNPSFPSAQTHAPAAQEIVEVPSVYENLYQAGNVHMHGTRSSHHGHYPLEYSNGASTNPYLWAAAASNPYNSSYYQGYGPGHHHAAAAVAVAGQRNFFAHHPTHHVPICSLIPNEFIRCVNVDSCL